jgi:hypothetical protein
MQKQQPRAIGALLLQCPKDNSCPLGQFMTFRAIHASSNELQRERRMNCADAHELAAP